MPKNGIFIYSKNYKYKNYWQIMWISDTFSVGGILTKLHHFILKIR